MCRITGGYDRIHVGANIPADRRLELFQLLKPGGLLCGVNMFYSEPSAGWQHVMRWVMRWMMRWMLRCLMRWVMRWV